MEEACSSTVPAVLRVHLLKFGPGTHYINIVLDMAHIVEVGRHAAARDSSQSPLQTLSFQWKGCSRRSRELTVICNSVAKKIHVKRVLVPGSCSCELLEFLSSGRAHSFVDVQ